MSEFFHIQFIQAYFYVNNHVRNVMVSVFILSCYNFEIVVKVFHFR